MKAKSILIISLVLLFYQPVKADFISLIRADQCETIIEIYVEEGQIRVTYEIGLKDWKYFKQIVPQELLIDEVNELIKSQGSNYFYENIFTLNADGKNLIGRIVKREIVPRKYRASLYTGVVDKNTNVSKEVLFVEIVYPLHQKARKVIITPPMEEGRRGTRASIGFVTYHKNIPVNDLRYLSQPSTLNLNWEDPWYSKFNNNNLRRHHQSSLMSFLYVDPYEVRHEVLVRVKDLEEWLPMKYKLGDAIEIEDQKELKETIGEFLVSRNLVTIDGELGNPIIDKIHFVKWSLAGIQIMEVPEPMDYSSAVIGVIFAYPHESIAQDVSINWDMFSAKIKEIPNVATDPAGPMPYILKEDDNILIWKNYLKKYKLPTISEVEVSYAKVPVLSLVAVLVMFFGVITVFKSKKRLMKLGIVLLLGGLIFVSGKYFQQRLTLPFIKQYSFSKPEAVSMIGHLLKNTYRAFDFREESDVYDKLAVSNDEELLTNLYIQTKKSMVMENQGGIQVKVKNVEIIDVEEVSSDKEGLSFKCKWIVTGDVGHWGHIHSRVNQYEAILSVQSKEGVWKVHDIEIIEEVRL
ncbi:hypothetical protein [Lutimonas sp.]|uniref:hypothetical protein n=1 Tax=Lutimonas sp. TaxID=1872403 RepID=UPI003D9B53B7